MRSPSRSSVGAHSLVDAGETVDALGLLPGVESATVDIGLFGQAQVSLVEGDAVAVWLTDAARLLVAEDGTVVGIQARDAPAEGSIALLPVIDDVRPASHDLSVGDQIAPHEVDCGARPGRARARASSGRRR